MSDGEIENCYMENMVIYNAADMILLMEFVKLSSLSNFFHCQNSNLTSTQPEVNLNSSYDLER